MNYEVRYDPSAEKQLEKLPSEITKRIIKKLKGVSGTGRGIETIKEPPIFLVLLVLSNNPQLYF